MDLVLRRLDELYFDDFYQKLSLDLQRFDTVRQCFSLFLVELIGVNILYFTFSTLSYYLLFDKTLTKHPRFLKNQVWKEIVLSVTSFPVTAVVTVPWFLFELKGYSKLYHDVDEYGWGYLFVSILGFIAFTDMGVYWFNREII
jgi:lathosterol oxidase